MSVAAIAGAAGSAGPEVARVLAGRGFDLTLGGRDEGRLPDHGGDRVLKYAVDLLDPGSARDWAGATVERFGRVDALVHLVGGWRGGQPIAQSPPEDDSFLLDSLVRTVQIASRAFLPALTEAGGRFVMVSSPQAERPSNTNAAYGAAKAAAEAWTLALRQELAEAGGSAQIVRVGVIQDPAPVAHAIARFVTGESDDERVSIG
jgi:NADP-dependent 3-hydroxy acid dehydrogenase YdfG